MLGKEILLVFRQRIFDTLPQVVVQRLLAHNVIQQSRLCRIKVGVKPGLEGANLLYLQIIEKAIGSGKNDDDLLLSRQRRELRLFQNFCEPLSSVELILCDLVQIAAELRKRSQLTILRKVELQGSRHLAHSLDLRAATDAAYGKADVHCRSNTGIEQVAFQVNLPIGDGNHVGRNV